jgi:ADP-dependent NAD(P)H-hydrate dehydratase / NAD(P)H-hydrate epimerase
MVSSIALVSLPDWLTPLPDAEQMRAIDRWAIDEQGVPSLDLMERAGQGVTRAVEELAADGPVVVVCGKGNNGGDGLVVARLLRDAGRAVGVLCTAPLDELSGDAAANLARLPGDPPRPMDDGMQALGEGAVIVDALLGTGFEGEPRSAVAAAIDAINAAQGRVVSVDVPSGVDASTGRVQGAGVRATVTVTFHAAKPGLWIRPGKAHAGEVRVIDIGIPRGAPAEARIGLIEPAVSRELPRREAASSKFSSGHVVVAGGSPDLSGAPRMAALSSARAGAGYVTACLPGSLRGVLAASLLEVMTRALPDSDGDLEAGGVPVVLDALARGGALALGPGLGRAPGALQFARELARQAPVAMVLDADGLGAHAGRMQELSGREAPTVLTPHVGELGRLLECGSEEVERERLASARGAAESARAVVVLKGDDTLVADRFGRVAVSQGNSPALATAGSGDVLTGVIAALLAQGLDAFVAACAGVWLHARAGRIAALRQGSVEGVVATDVIAALPAAREEERT